MGAHTVYAIGECMIELQRSSEGAGGTMDYRFGGDTLNTAVYMARLLDPAVANVAYVTGLGVDGMSAEMLAAWEREGIETAWVQRLPDRLEGVDLAGVERVVTLFRADEMAHEQGGLEIPQHLPAAELQAL